MRDDQATAIRAFLGMVSNLAAAQIIPVRDPGKRPGKPYFTYEIGRRTNDGGDPAQLAKVDGPDVITTYRADRRLFVSVTGYGAGSLDLLEAVEDALPDTEATAGLSAAGLEFSISQGVRSVPQRLDGADQFEERGILDVEFTAFSRREVNHGSIDRVVSKLQGDPLIIDVG